MPYAQIEDGVRLYYELTGPDHGPVILQLGGGLFGLVVLAAQLGPCALRLEQRLQLIEAQAEQIAQPHDLVDALHIGRRVDAVLTLNAVRGAGE